VDDQQGQDLLPAGVDPAVQAEMDTETMQEPLAPVFGYLIQSHRGPPSARR
jgi:hypothetical protein